MWDFIISILDQLEIDDYMAINTRERVKLIHESEEKARALLDHLDKIISGGNCFECGNRFFCAFFRACIYYELGELDNAIAQVKQAAHNFELNCSIWNETLTLWLHGKLLIEQKKETQARAMLAGTIENFIYLGKKARHYDKYEKYKAAKNAIDAINKELQDPKTFE